MGKKKQQRGKGKAKKSTRCKAPTADELALRQADTFITNCRSFRQRKCRDMTRKEIVEADRDKVMENLTRRDFCADTGAIEEAADDSAAACGDKIESYLSEKEWMDYSTRKKQYEEIFRLKKIQLNSRVRYIERRIERNNQVMDIWREGIVKEINPDAVDECKRYGILPLDVEDMGKNNELIHSQGGSPRIVDAPWFPKFQVGDLVVAKLNKRTWHLARVENQRQIKSWIEPPLYRLKALHRPKSKNLLFSYSEQREEIRAYKPPRFKVGQNVICSEPGKQDSWKKCAIVNVNCFESYDFHATYLVSLLEPEKWRKWSDWFVGGDTDEQIADINATLRERFMDAIQQRCSYSHLCDLVEMSGLDVSSFSDTVIDMAIQHGSYTGLWWIRNKLDVDLRQIRDAKGNSLLHQIAMSSHAEDFFEMALEYSSIEGKFEVGSSALPLDSENDEGHSWLRELVLSGGCRALELACCPHSRLGRNVLEMLLNKGSLIEASREKNKSSTQHLAHLGSRDTGGNTLKDLALSLKEFKLAKMIDEIAEQATLLYLAKRFKDYQYDEYDLIPSYLEAFRDDTPDRILQRIVKFARQYMELDIFALLATLPSRLVQAGDIDTFSWLVEAMPIVPGPTPICDAFYKLVVSLENMDEFTQPELFASKSFETQQEEKSVMAHCVHGVLDMEHPIQAGMNQEDIQAYYTILDLCSCFDESFEEYLDSEKDSKNISTGLRSMLLYRVALLRDAKDSERRLQMLEYLVFERNLTPPNVIDTIRFRQCGMLKWLVERSLVKLGDLAKSNKDISDCHKKFRFLGGKKTPESMSVGQVLCFAAIQYDDLQSLRWLLLEQLVDIKIVFDGWNLVHACAHFGRVEIFLWLLGTFQEIRDLVRSPSGRKKQVGLFAVHLALRHGFTYLADRLLKAGCPHIDELRRPLVWHTTNSSLVIVRQWGEQNKPRGLVDDLSDLLVLVASCPDESVSEAKRLICTSRCLDPERWEKEFSCSFWDHPGPRGITYVGVIHKCCEKGIPDFISWLFDHIWRGWMVDDAKKSFFGHSKPKTSKGVTLMEMSMFNPNDAFWKFLDTKWAKTLRAEDPVLAFGMVYFLQTHNGKIEEAVREWRGRTIQKELRFRLFRKANSEIRDMLSKGVAASEINEIAIAMRSHIATIQDEFDGSCKPSSESFIITKDGRLNLNASLTLQHNAKTHVVFKQRLALNFSEKTIRSLHMAMVIEGYAHLVEWSLSSDWNAWDIETELTAIRTASFLGHRHVVDLFLKDHHKQIYQSSRFSRLRAVCLGAAEGSRMADLEAIVSKLCISSEPAPISHVKRTGKPKTKNRRSAGLTLLGRLLHSEEKVQLTSVKSSGKVDAKVTIIDSLIGSTLFGCLENTEDDVFMVLNWVLDQFEVPPEKLLCAMIEDPNCVYGCKAMARFVSLFKYLVTDKNLNIWIFQDEIAALSKKYLKFLDRGCNNEYDDRMQICLDWIGRLVSMGLDIQSLKPPMSKTTKDFRDRLRSLKEQQQKSWSTFDVLKKGVPFSSVISSFNNGMLDTMTRDAKGLLVSHIAAAHDRQDVLSWMVDSLGTSLHETDGRGRTVLEVAEQCNAVDTYRWVKRRLSETRLRSFITTNFLRRRAMREKALKLNSLRRLQALYRGFKVRSRYQETLNYKLNLSRSFYSIWKCTLDIFDKGASKNHLSWINLKHDSFDMQPDVEDTWQETSGKLTAAVAEVMQDTTDEDSDHLVGPEQMKSSSREIAHQSIRVQTSCPCLRGVKLTKYAWKWVENSDLKYRRFFVAKIQRLANGDRSRTLSKRLKGTNKAVFETYLEQKSGHRILWTTEPAIGLVIWYVATHDRVSRLALLIDQADQRTGRQLSSASEMSELQEVENLGSSIDGKKAKIVVDPFGNTPLKLYELQNGEIAKLHDVTWKPQLYLTDEERHVVEKKGTVLVLGRSGTGKTICICNRIDYDRTVAEANDQHISQLFVARSQKLCRYVQGTVGQGSTSSTRFTTFSQLLSSLEHETILGDEKPNRFIPSSQVGLFQFQCMTRSSDSVESLLVWAHIRTFIKGSIDVVQRNRSLTRDEYLQLGKKECRLDSSQRNAVYDAYERYERYCADCGMWDDCDRVAHVLRRLQSLRQINETMFSSLQFDKIYVDEIQDYTQAEMALFFTLTGPGDLFLAGDPAQAVVEGVEFRFESCRSVAFHLYGQENHHLVPDKPKIINVNFRSHSGILNVAAGVLKHLFNAFPDCAKQLKEDRGLFRGPRPGLIGQIDYGVLKDLVRRIDGLVILCHDENASQLRQKLDGYPFCYGIRETKGLEFKTVLILDFFSAQKDHLQNAWRDLFLDRDTHYVNQTHPELERQLKLLYTAVTRSISKLYFAETASNMSVEAFGRWIIESQLAVRQCVNNIGAFMRTQDEWRAAGVDHAVTAEGYDDPRQTVASLERAIYCFDQIGDAGLRRKANINRQSAQFRTALLRTLDSAKNVTQENRDQSDPIDLQVMQRQASQVLSSLIREQLLIEARKVCDVMLPQLHGDGGYARKVLQNQLVSKLPSYHPPNESLQL